MHGQQDNRDLAALYESVLEEGVFSRAGARIAGAKAGAGQYFKNIKSTLTGKAAPVSAGDAARSAKLNTAYTSAAKGLLTDLQKLGLLPKGSMPQQATDQTVSTLANLVSQMQPSAPAQQQTTTQVPANAPGQPAQQQSAPAASPVASAPATATATPPALVPAASAAAGPALPVATATKPTRKKKATVNNPVTPVANTPVANTPATASSTPAVPAKKPGAAAQKGINQNPNTDTPISSKTQRKFEPARRKFEAAQREFDAFSQGKQADQTPTNKAQKSKESKKAPQTPEERKQAQLKHEEILKQRDEIAKKLEQVQQKRKALEQGRKGKGKKTKSENNEDFAFSSNLSFKKYFGSK